MKKKNLQKLKQNYKADLRIYLEAHVSLLFICVEVNMHQIIKKILLPQNQQVEPRQIRTKQKNNKSQRKQNKKPPKQQKADINTPVAKRDFDSKHQRDTDFRQSLEIKVFKISLEHLVTLGHSCQNHATSHHESRPQAAFVGLDEGDTGHRQSVSTPGSEVRRELVPFTPKAATLPFTKTPNLKPLFHRK